MARANPHSRRDAPGSEEFGGNRLPLPQSVVAQTAAILREKIQTGGWRDLLPSERQLCEWLVVSRGTLRSALMTLARENMIRSRQGQRWKIVNPNVTPRRPSATRNLALLAPWPLNMLTPFEIFWIDILRGHLQDAGYQLNVCHDATCFTSRPDRALSKLAAKVAPAGWVLHAAPAAVQQWFSKQKLPCVIVGSRHAGVRLPSVDRDLPAVCRHAVGRLAAHGHKRLALLIPDANLAGDLACEQSFTEAAESRPGIPHGQGLIARHDGSVRSIQREIDLLLGRREPPTGFLVTGTKFTLGALSYLLSRGGRFPKPLALISRDNDPFLDYVVPTVARYSVDPTLFARKVSRIVLRLIQGGNVPTQIQQVMPTFIPGQTLG